MLFVPALRFTVTDVVWTLFQLPSLVPGKVTVVATPLTVTVADRPASPST